MLLLQWRNSRYWKIKETNSCRICGIRSHNTVTDRTVLKRHTSLTTEQQVCCILGEVGEGVAVNPVLNKWSTLTLCHKLTQAKPVLHTLLTSGLPLQRALNTASTLITPDRLPDIAVQQQCALKSPVNSRSLFYVHFRHWAVFNTSALWHPMFTYHILYTMQRNNTYYSTNKL